MTRSNYFRTNVRYLLFTSSVLAFLSFSLFTICCADNPTALGLKFIPPGDTIGIKIFDSNKDTMQITTANHRRYVNTAGSTNLIVGQSGAYNSKALIKFYGLPTGYDSAVISSAKLKLYYKNYYFPVSTSDSTGPVSFDVYKVLKDLNYFSITLDSVNSTNFGTTSMGSYTGSPAKDSAEIDVTLNNTLVQNWLYHAADSSHGEANYGIALTPNTGSSVLKGFYSASSFVSGLTPTLWAIATKNGHTDTITVTGSQDISLINADLTPLPSSFVLQGGVSYVEVLRFDVSKIPSTAVVNDAQLYLTIDSANSIFTNQTAYSIVPAYLDDTTLNNIEALSTADYGTPVGTSPNVYLFRLILPFQRWIQGFANYGIVIRAANQTANLDKFAFYGVNAPDPSKRPRVVIKYTPRIP